MKRAFILPLLLGSLYSYSQDTTLATRPVTALAAQVQQTRDKEKKISSLIIPGTLITYGIVTIGSNGLKEENADIKEELWTEHPHLLVHADNYLQFAPAAMVYGLNALGIHGQHNLRDRSLIYLTSNTLLNTMVYAGKSIFHQMRPDSSGYTSFPSGHTAEAFASAEFLRQEYKDVSPWYGVAGYAMAAATGYLRMYNNKHWLSDVVAGAGVGILSTKLAYWMYPFLERKVFHFKPATTMVMPFYQNHTAGLSLVYRFRH